MLDLEDAVPPRRQGRRPARMVAEALADAPARGCGSTPRAPTVRGRPRRRRRARRTASASPRPSPPTTCVGRRPGAGHAAHLRDRDRPRGARRARDRRRAGRAPPRDGRRRPAARPQHRRRQPADPLRALPPRLWSRARPGSRRRSTACSRTSTTTPGLRAQASSRGRSASSASPPSTRGSCRSCTTSSRPSERRSPGRERSSTLRARRRRRAPAARRRVRRPPGRRPRPPAPETRRQPCREVTTVPARGKARHCCPVAAVWGGI